MAKTINSRVGLSPHLTIFPDLTSTQRQSDEVKVNTNSSRVGKHPQLPLSATGMQVVHATNGRIRIKATDASFSCKFKAISQDLRQYHGIKEVATNEETGSMVVTFDHNQLSLSQILGILQRFNMQTSPNSPLSDPFAPWKSADFWKEQTVSFIPLMTGLAVTGGLGISGFAAIPIYMIAADAARRVIDYLEPQVIGSDAVKESAKTVVRSGEGKPAIAEYQKSGKVAYNIIHQIPGRIRLHIPRIASDRAYGKRLERLLKTDAFVTNLRMNCDAASLAIAYKGREIARSHWVSLMELALQKNPATPTISTIEPPTPPAIEKLPITSPASEMVTKLTEPTDAALSATQEQTLNISSFWVEMKPPALSYSLNFIANLPL